MEQFEVGDIVQLKSGGPKMTVADPNRPAGVNKIQVHCQWFAGRKLESGLFPPEVLIKATEEDKDS